MEEYRVKKDNREWRIQYQNGNWVVVGENGLELKRVLETVKEGVEVRTVVAGDGVIGHGVKLVTDVNDLEYFVGLRAVLFENGYRIEA